MIRNCKITRYVLIEQSNISRKCFVCFVIHKSKAGKQPKCNNNDDDT